MYWTLTIERETAKSQERADGTGGRFVLHRHRDSIGPHFDLRLEQGGSLVGWRIDGDSLDGELWASEKASHPLRWLDVDGDAIRELSGTYCWVKRDHTDATLELVGGDDVWRVRASRTPGLSPSVVRSVAGVLAESGYEDVDAASLIADGVCARQRALERLCGLGRELDGGAFDESVWRHVSRSLSLEEIHAQLRAYEARFDAKYPPSPASRPEALDGEAEGARLDAAMAIARQ